VCLFINSILTNGTQYIEFQLYSYSHTYVNREVGSLKLKVKLKEKNKNIY